MKKWSFIFLLFLPLFASGQENYMSLSFGGSIPINNFIEVTDLTKHGYANNGIAGDYSGAYFFSKHLGVVVNAKYSSNPLSDRQVVDDLLSETQIYFQENNIHFDTTEFIAKTGIWNHISLTSGPELTLARGNFNFDFFALGGLNFIFPPNMSVIIASGYSRTFDARAISYALEAGTAIRFHLSEKSSLRFHFSYLRSNVIGTINKTFIENSISNSQNIDFSCPIETLNIGIGVVYRLI